jgi:hypothetical protein
MVGYTFHPAMPFSVTLSNGIRINPGETKRMPRSSARALTEYLRRNHPTIVLTHTEHLYSRLTPAAAESMRDAIRDAGGREVCFVCTVDTAGVVQTARVAARGDAGRVLALPSFTRRGEMLVHNHPNGLLEPSDADNEAAAHLYGQGVGFGIIDNEARELYVVVEVPR